MSNNYICCCAPLRRKLWPLRPIEVLFYTSGWGNIIYWDLIHSGKEKTTCHMCELQMEKCEICLSYREYINKIFFVNDVLIYQLCLKLTFVVLPPPLRKKSWPLCPTEVLFYTRVNIMYWNPLHSGKEKATRQTCKLWVEKMWIISFQS
jgi:hypothetical protein